MIIFFHSRVIVSFYYHGVLVLGYSWNNKGKIFRTVCLLDVSRTSVCMSVRIRSVFTFNTVLTKMLDMAVYL